MQNTVLISCCSCALEYLTHEVLTTRECSTKEYSLSEYSLRKVPACPPELANTKGSTSVAITNKGAGKLVPYNYTNTLRDNAAAPSPKTADNPPGVCVYIVIPGYCGVNTAYTRIPGPNAAYGVITCGI